MWFFFFKQKTAYEMRISDWSSDVCSSDLPDGEPRAQPQHRVEPPPAEEHGRRDERELHHEDAQHHRSGRLAAQRAEQALQVLPARRAAGVARSEERRGGKEWVSTCSSRWSP